MNNKELENKVKEITNSLIYEKGYVCSVDMLIRLDYLTKNDYEDWRFGRIEYLEKACKINLSKLSLINKTIRKISKELKLKKSWTGYNQYGKELKRRIVFSKSGDKKIEDAYATHYVDIKRINELKMNKANV